MLNRRNFLKGTGVLISLPMLESFGAAEKKEAPTRLVYLGFIYGITGGTWFPKTTGKNYELTNGLAPLAKHRKEFTVFGNLSNHHSRDSHWSNTTLLTGADLRRTPGRSFHNSISCDQVAAKYLGKETRYNSIEMTCNDQGTGPGLSLAWDQAGKPLPGMSNPTEFYNFLFGDNTMSLAERKYHLKKEKSVLDSVVSQSKGIQKDLTAADKDKLDEYFQSIRQLEVRLAKAERWFDRPKPKATIGAPKSEFSGTESIRTMYDLLVAALQTDQSRVISYRQPIRPLLRELEIPFGPHELNHHPSKDGATEMSKKKDKLNTELLSYLFDKLKSTKDINGQSLFENTITSWSCGIRAGHGLRNVPTIVAGGGKRLKHQGFVKVKEGKTQLSNLWLSTMKAAGVPVEQFSDSKGIVEEIMA